MAQSKESARLFKNDFCEKFTHVHPITPLVIFVPIVSGFLWHALRVQELGGGEAALLVASGLVFWTLAEYVLHRFVFHYQFKSVWGQRFHYIIHGNHHHIPDDASRLVMPPFAGLVLATVFYLLFRVVLGSTWVSAFNAGFLSGYLCYDYIHFAVHHFKPRTPVGRFLKQSHMIHHFANENARWGVSSPLWDIVFGSMSVREKRPAGEERTAV